MGYGFQGQGHSSCAGRSTARRWTLQVPRTIAPLHADRSRGSSSGAVRKLTVDSALRNRSFLRKTTDAEARRSPTDRFRAKEQGRSIVGGRSPDDKQNCGWRDTATGKRCGRKPSVCGASALSRQVRHCRCGGVALRDSLRRSVRRTWARDGCGCVQGVVSAGGHPAIPHRACWHSHVWANRCSFETGPARAATNAMARSDAM